MKYTEENHPKLEHGYPEVVRNRERITLDMSGMDVMMTMSGGNPGAATVCMNLMKEAPTIDPDSALGPFGPILSLDSFGVYGPMIWLLFKDCCGARIDRVMGVLRCVQMGILPWQDLKETIESCLDYERRPPFGEAFAFASLKEKLHAELPNFKWDDEEAVA